MFGSNTGACPAALANQDCHGSTQALIAHHAHAVVSCPHLILVVGLTATH